jgi:hypothetical protein
MISHYISNNRLLCSALASIILKEVYDLDIRDLNDPYVVNVGKVLSSANAVGITGSFLVDTIPMRAFSSL